MATVFWIGNAENIAQVDTITITAVALSGTLTVTINTKPVTYTCTASDTTTTAASALLALLQTAAGTLGEFGEINWSSSGAIITATASVPGTPFTLSVTGAGGSTLTLTHTTANNSQSDVGDLNNWLRSGVNAIPVNGDDVVLTNSSVPLLWNLTALAAVQFATYTRYQDFTGTVGLPENNPRGYYEYRPTYFKFVGSGTLLMLLGQGTGGGPSRERYDLGAQRCNWVVLGAGGAIDNFAIRLLSTHASNTLSVLNTSVGVAMLPAEVSTIASASVGPGGTLGLGPGVTFSGALDIDYGTLTTYIAPATLTVSNGANVTVRSTGLTYTAITARMGGRITWISNSSITTLTMGTGSIFNKGGDFRAITITNSTIDGDTCQILDPLNTITFTNATTVNNTVSTGPFTFGPGRTVKVS